MKIETDSVTRTVVEQNDSDAAAIPFTRVHQNITNTDGATTTRDSRLQSDSPRMVEHISRNNRNTDAAPRARDTRVVVVYFVVMVGVFIMILCGFICCLKK